MFHFVNSSISSSRLSATAEPIIDPPRFNLEYTGNMHERRQRPHQWPVYPCAYREHVIHNCFIDFMCGLSLCIQGTCVVFPFEITPHTVYPCAYREHAFTVNPCTCRERFIPVHTGNMPISGNLPYVIVGLSLCIQGTFIVCPKCKYCTRFIPVHTGNIFILKNIKWRVTVYPCAYREHENQTYDKASVYGLSLCIQGTSLHHQCLLHLCRFIPVHTGNILIITYCFIIKILTSKFLPIF